MRREDLIEFARRDWQSVAEAKDRFWVDQKRRMTPAEALHLADDLRLAVIRQRSDWPSDEERAADLATHARVSESLQRVPSTRALSSRGSGRIRGMERNLEDLASEALQMSVESRAALAKRLLDSLDDLAPEEYERMWVEEAARRYEQLKAGTARAIPSEDVFAKLEARPRR